MNECIVRDRDKYIKPYRSNCLLRCASWRSLFNTITYVKYILNLYSLG
jgi:hypothetical protein